MNILVIDDDRSICNLFQINLEAIGHACTTVFTGEQALRKIEENQYDLAIIDQMLGEGKTGTETGKSIKKMAPDLQLIMITGHYSEQLKQLADSVNFFAILQKPINDFSIIEKIINELSRPIGNKTDNNEIIGCSPKLKFVIERADSIAGTTNSILIFGPTGTGKEGLARHIHSKSRRSDRKFLPVNCAGLTATLIESELFGHTKGAFTGATSTRKGKFEEAQDGTIFLDEIGDMPLESQSKLLRVLQERNITKVGSNNEINVDVRVIAATNRDLLSMVKQGTFRGDLYYRLNVTSLTLPPLNERGDDKLLLTEHFLSEEKKANDDKRNITLSNDAKKTLMEYPWPGNVRQLENVVKSAYARVDKKKTTILLNACDFELEHEENSINIDNQKSDADAHGTLDRTVSKPQTAVPSNSENSIGSSLTLKDVADYIKMLRLKLHETLDGSRGQILLLADEIEELKKEIWGKTLNIPEIDSPRQALIFLYGKGAFEEGKKMKNKAGGIIRTLNLIEAAKNKKGEDINKTPRYPDFISVANQGLERGTKKKTEE